MSQKLNFFEDFMLSGIAAGISKVSLSTHIVRIDQFIRSLWLNFVLDRSCPNRACQTFGPKSG